MWRMRHSSSEGLWMFFCITRRQLQLYIAPIMSGFQLHAINLYNTEMVHGEISHLLRRSSHLRFEISSCSDLSNRQSHRMAFTFTKLQKKNRHQVQTSSLSALPSVSPVETWQDSFHVCLLFVCFINQLVSLHIVNDDVSHLAA